MKKLYSLFIVIIVLSCEILFAQPPQYISYQAIARNNSGDLVSNQTVSIRFTIREGTTAGTILYQENHSAATNLHGLLTLSIGQGNQISGSFSGIDWDSNLKFLQVEMDVTGGSNYADFGTQQLVSVPYALSAANGNFNKAGDDIYNSNSGNVGIGTNAPVSSAQLEVKSTTKGFLPPRLTYSQRNAMVNPVLGMVICCTNCSATSDLQMYNGYNWISLISGTSGSTGTLTLCSQTWMSKNLDVDKYRNGDPIPKVTDMTQWASLTTGAYCYYENDSAANAAVYGKLYNWYAVNDPRGLAPEGWHIPTDSEWSTLSTCLGGNAAAGGALKETGTAHWSSPNTGATNSSGFTALPGGYRNVNGLFLSRGNVAYFWSSTEFDAVDASFRYITFDNGSLQNTTSWKVNGFTIRCVRD